MELPLSLSHTLVCTHSCVRVYYQATDDGTSPAIVAALFGHESTVRVLAELNADMNKVTGESY